MSEAQTAFKPGSAPIVRVYQDEDVRIAMTHWPLKGDPATVEAALAPPPALVTRVIWENMSLADRLEAAATGEINKDNLVSNDMTQVYTEKAIGWLSAWQSLVNSHAVWHADFDLGMIARRLITRGFLVAAHTKGRSWHDKEVESRFDFTPGMPGSIQWVSAMMGMEYAHLIDRIP